MRAFLDKLFFVEIPPEGLQLKREYFIIPRGNAAYIRSDIAHGTNITLDWNLGNGKQLLSAGWHEIYLFIFLPMFQIFEFQLFSRANSGEANVFIIHLLVYFFPVQSADLLF